MTKKITPKAHGKAILKLATTVSKAAKQLDKILNDKTIDKHKKEAALDKYTKMIEDANKEYDQVNKAVKAQNNE